MKTMWLVTRRRRKAQSLVEFALGGILLVMLMAASIDMGRAFYTWIVVQNMAGEGAAYLAQQPDNDYNIDPSNPTNTFQGRARAVAARAMGGIIDPTHVVFPTYINVNVPPSDRCAGTAFDVSVGYNMDDLFFPALLGLRSLMIGADANSAFFTSAGAATSCPTATPLPP
ncbi:MAG TPA: TadE family protein [Chloroflexia bacterium]|nr:TadE family protein [Chloroflexia bacterium]